MSNSIEIRFWDRPNAIGWKNAEIITDSFCWKISEAQFEEIHGLSRVVRLLADKIVTTFVIFKELPESPAYDKNFLIDLVLELLRHYERLSSSRNAALLDNIQNEEHSFEVKIGNGWLGRFPEAPSVTGTITQLKTSLLLLQHNIEIYLEANYWRIAEEIMKSADQIREICDTYLDVVHPALISSRRPVNPGELTIDDRMHRLEEKLEEKRDHLLLSFRHERIMQRVEP